MRSLKDTLKDLAVIINSFNNESIQIKVLDFVISKIKDESFVFDQVDLKVDVEVPHKKRSKVSEIIKTEVLSLYEIDKLPISEIVRKLSLPYHTVYWIVKGSPFFQKTKEKEEP